MIDTTKRLGQAAAANRRGVAMLLVIVALGTATVLAMSHLASRRNSPAIGQNAVAAADAEGSAQAGADVAEAILQTDRDWRSASADTVLFSDIALGDATLEVRLTNLQGDPPDENDNDLIVTSIATVGGMRGVSERIVRVNPDVSIEEAVDPELLEFAAFASERVRIDNGATLAPWPLSPASTTGGVTKLGAGFNNLSDLIVDDGATLSNVALYPDSGASSGLIDEISDSQYTGGGEIPLSIPTVRASLPGDLSSLPNVGGGEDGEDGDSDESSEDWDVPNTPVSAPSGNYQDVTIKNDAIVVVGDSGNTEFSVKSMTVDNGGVLRVDGQVRMHVRGKLEIKNGGTVELNGSDSSITFYTADQVKVNDAALGLTRDLARNFDRTRQDVSQYQNASRIRILALDPSDGGKSDPDYRIDNNSLAVASIHAPGGELHIHNESTLFGRVAADYVDLDQDTALLYDPMRDSGAGFTNLDGPLYDENGEPIGALQDALDTFTGGGLEAFQNHLASALGDALGGALGALAGGNEPSEPFITPRSADRARGLPWPILALAMERRDVAAGIGASDVMAGSFVQVNSDQQSGGQSGGGQSSFTSAN